MKLLQRLILSVGLVMLSLSVGSSAVAQGPGTEMTQIINRMGLGSDCGRCKALAAEMDQRGPDWVLQTGNRSPAAPSITHRGWDTTWAQ